MNLLAKLPPAIAFVRISRLVTVMLMFQLRPLARLTKPAPVMRVIPGMALVAAKTMNVHRRHAKTERLVTI